MKNVTAGVWLASLAAAAMGHADVRLPAVLTSNMVVQAEADVALWGWADPGERVKVTPDWLPKGAATTADEKGRWRVSVRTPGYAKGVDPFAAHTIRIEGKNAITLENVLIGEVWIASGQSNMEMFVGDHGGGYRGVDNWKDEAARATHTGVRLFDVENAISAKPEEECRSRALGGKTGWVECTPSSVVDFSGTAYFFGRELRERLNVPIGLISTDWGGTPAEAWTSEEGLREFPEYKEAVEWVRVRREGTVGKGDDALAEWWKKVDDADRKVMVRESAHWKETAFDDSSWGMTRLPSSFAGDLAGFDGLVWVRRSVAIPAAWAGKDLTLSLGPIDDMDVTYFDGVEVGATIGSNKWFHPRTYTIPGNLVKGGMHTLAVRVLDVSGPGGMNGEASQLWVRPADGSGEAVALDGYWKMKTGAPMKDLPAMTEGSVREMNAHTPTALSNAMIAPLANMAIKGAIWYQGESNRGRPEQYSRLLAAMITDWRTRWGRGDFPFYFVQIAPFTYGGDTGQTATLRESQRRVLSLPNTGMAVTMDIGNPADIHPSNKQDVGKRLALWALAKAYGKADVAYSGPLAAAVTPEAGGLRVRFEHGAGLAGRGGPVTNLELAGADGKFVPATGEVVGDALVVRAAGVGAPVAVRYGWCDSCAPNLVNGAGLPASPFELRVTR